MMTQPPAPPLRERTELQATSIELCRKHVESELEGEYQIEPLEAELEWDPISLRYVYDQPMVVWRRFSAFEVILDEQDRPVGFVDEGQWLSCAWCELPPEEAEALVRTTGLIPTGLPLAGRSRGEKDCLELVFSDGRPGTLRVRARINPSRRAVISVGPEEGL